MFNTHNTIKAKANQKTISYVFNKPGKISDQNLNLIKPFEQLFLCPKLRHYNNMSKWETCKTKIVT